MKIPQRPPPFSETIRKQTDGDRLGAILELARQQIPSEHYLHWDKLRRLKPPEGFTLEEWWLAIKLQRNGVLKAVPLNDKEGKPFRFCTPDIVQQELHEIDVGAGRSIGIPEPITNPQTRDTYLVRSLMEEAINSSQLEGAVTTREVAKEMIRTGRPPRDTSEQMILNNFVTMQRIAKWKEEPLSPEMILDIHRLVAEKTLEDPTAARRGPGGPTEGDVRFRECQDAWLLRSSGPSCHHAAFLAGL